MQGKQIKNVFKLKFLGRITSTNRRQTEEIANRISKVYKTLYRQFFDEKEITNKTKTCVYAHLSK